MNARTSVFTLDGLFGSGRVSGSAVGAPMFTPSFRPWAFTRMSMANQASADFAPGVIGSSVQLDSTLK